MTTQSTSVLDQVRMPNGQVFIRAGKEIDEWVYLELQGELQSTSASINLQRTQEPGSASYLLGMPLGDFQFEPQGKATLRIGNHLLTGQYKKLSKPLLITKSELDVEDPTLSSQPDTSDASGSSQHRKRLRVLGLVRGKYLFETRPAPIVQAPSTTTSASRRS